MKTRADILVAGVGNVLHGDDGFGIELARRLQAGGVPDGARVIETGIGGMGLVHEAMDGCRALLLLDAYRRGGAPGQLYLLEPELPELGKLDVHQRRDYFADTHYATPLRALSLLAELGRLPELVHILGCEPAEHEELGMDLSPAVTDALYEAEERVRRWLEERLAEA